MANQSKVRSSNSPNDTKWDEFIAAMRARTEWRPSYRYKCIDGPPSGWDVEWFYHLPFPLMSVEWLDIAYLQEVREHRLPPVVHAIDHSGWVEELLRAAGLDFRKGVTMIRVLLQPPQFGTIRLGAGSPSHRDALLAGTFPPGCQ